MKTQVVLARCIAVVDSTSEELPAGRDDSDAQCCSILVLDAPPMLSAVAQGWRSSKMDKVESNILPIINLWRAAYATLNRGSYA